MEDLKSTNTPMSSSIKLDNDNQGTSIDVTKYQDMIGSLLYLIVSRLDIMFSVWLQANPKRISS